MSRNKVRQPPVQGVQIANQVSNIRICALDTSMSLEERQTLMHHHYQLARSMLDSYYNHFVVLTENLEK